MSTQHTSFSRAHLRLDGISVTFAGRRVLTDVSLTVPAGERLGLIGENGSGKSTLLRIAAGLVEPDAGSVLAVHGRGPGAARIGLLHQEAPFGVDDTVAEAVESAVAPARRAVAAVDVRANELAERAGDPATVAAYAAALEEAERLDAWATDARIAAMLSGLGLGALPLTRRVAELSGGQRARLSLAWVLLSDPDVLLLDEPSNHLDDAATEHLRRTLLAWRGPVLFASHDRAFLDEVATGIVDLDPAELPLSATDEDPQAGEPGAAARDAASPGREAGSGYGITRFTGSYSDYLRTRSEARARWERRYRDEQHELAKLRAGVGSSQQVGHADWKPRTETRAAQKFYSDRNARVVARRVNDARSRLEDLEARQIRQPPEELRFLGVPTRREPLGAGPVRDDAAPVIAATSLAVLGRLDPVSFELNAGERLLVTGANGAGKSTLLRLISGHLPPSSGALAAPDETSIGLLTQEVSVPDPRGRGPERTARQAYEDAVGEALAEAVPLRTFGLLASRDEGQPVRVLSLGQQRRLELAILLAKPPRVLLLDEPTNHLSLPLVTALEQAIVDYPGEVIVASHDRWLRRGWTGAQLELNPVRADASGHPEAQES